MFQDLLKNVALGALRHFLTGLGGALVADGYLSTDQSTQAVGAAIALAGLAWSAYQKYQTQKATGLTGNAAPVVPVEVKPLDPVK